MPNWTLKTFLDRTLSQYREKHNDDLLMMPIVIGDRTVYLVEVHTDFMLCRRNPGIMDLDLILIPFAANHTVQITP